MQLCILPSKARYSPLPKILDLLVRLRNSLLPSTDDSCDHHAATGQSGCGAWKPQNSRHRPLNGRVTVVDVQGFRLKAAVPVRESRFPTPGYLPVVPSKGWP